MDHVEAALAELPSDSPPGAEGIEGSRQRRAPFHRLVRLQAAAVAQHLEALGGVTEGDHLNTTVNTAVLPRRPQAFGMRGEDGHPVAAPRQPQGQVADERSRGVPRKTGIRLREEEEVEARMGGIAGAHSSHSLIE